MAGPSPTPATCWPTSGSMACRWSTGRKPSRSSVPRRAKRCCSSGSACPTVARGVEAFQPPSDAIEAVLKIMAAGKLDVCGVEYLESERDGRRYFYDVNALSNFVADAPRVIGFDPFVNFVDYLERRAREDATRPPERALAGA